MVPPPGDTDELGAFGPSGGDGEPGPSGGDGAQPSPPAGGAGGALKVELDLDDAPFLLDDEPEEAAPAPAGSGEAPPGEKPAAGPGLFSKLSTFFSGLFARLRFRPGKKLVIGGAALALLAVGGLAAWLFLKPSGETAKEDVPQKPVVQLPPETPQAPPPPDAIPVRFEPFLIELAAPDGATRFLQFRFSSTTTNKKLADEITKKNLVLRDATYYYLKNKSLEFLADPKNVESVKRDLLTVLNQYLGADQLQTILVEEYLIK